MTKPAAPVTDRELERLSREALKNLYMHAPGWTSILRRYIRSLKAKGRKKPTANGEQSGGHDDVV